MAGIEGRMMGFAIARRKTRVNALVAQPILRIALLRRMGPRLRGDDSKGPLLHIILRGDERRAWTLIGPQWPAVLLRRLQQRRRPIAELHQQRRLVGLGDLQRARLDVAEAADLFRDRCQTDREMVV